MRTRAFSKVVNVPLSMTACFAPLASGKQIDTVGAKVEGRIFVTDSEGKESFVAGARAKRTGAVTCGTAADEHGKCALETAPFGTYALEAVFAGPKAAAPIRVQTSQVQADLELKAIPVTDSLVVTVDQDKSSNPAPSETIPTKTLREGPNVNERFESSFPLIPGVLRGPDRHISLKGARNTKSGANLPIEVVSFPRFSSFDLQITRPVSLNVGEKPLHAPVGVSVFNLFNHFIRRTYRTILQAPASDNSSQLLARIPRQICLES
jgi:hypothetical protein